MLGSLSQRTIGKKVEITGIGIHSGKKVTLKLFPAGANHGITFQRTDIKGAEILPAKAHLVGATENNTTLGEGENVVHTVEHLLSALYGLGIDNLRCEIDGPEVPIMDGSGASFVFILKESGIGIINAPRSYLVVLTPIKVAVDDKWATLEPHPRLIIDSTIVFPHPLIKKQNRVFEFSCENYLQEVSRARTFALMRDVDYLKRRGLIKGGSLDNAVVLDEFKVVNTEGLRFKDEFVRHKILDTLGDIALLGHDLIGKITTYKSGHNLHNLLCRELLSNKNNYEIVTSSSLREESMIGLEIPSGLIPVAF
jgi:UDP-3-O-[3-hydroxymyristoyl] N-acetylglucosamine deacetylase